MKSIPLSKETKELGIVSSYCTAKTAKRAKETMALAVKQIRRNPTLRPEQMTSGQRAEFFKRVGRMAKSHGIPVFSHATPISAKGLPPIPGCPGKIRRITSAEAQREFAEN